MNGCLHQQFQNARVGKVCLVGDGIYLSCGCKVLTGDGEGMGEGKLLTVVGATVVWALTGGEGA